jgi:hypothetical protein
VIHATAIGVDLPHLLEAGEVLKRPSLGAGNDPSRPSDVETDRGSQNSSSPAGTVTTRCANDKRSRTSCNSLRMSPVEPPSCTSRVNDYSLPYDDQVESVLGTGPLTPVADLFEAKFGSLNQPISDFVKGRRSRRDRRESARAPARAVRRLGC